MICSQTSMLFLKPTAIVVSLSSYHRCVLLLFFPLSPLSPFCPVTVLPGHVKGEYALAVALLERGCDDIFSHIKRRLLELRIISASFALRKQRRFCAFKDILRTCQTQIGEYWDHGGSAYSENGTLFNQNMFFSHSFKVSNSCQSHQLSLCCLQEASRFPSFLLLFLSWGLLTLRALSLYKLLPPSVFEVAHLPSWLPYMADYHDW